MRLTAKLVIALVLLIVAIVGAAGTIMVRSEIALLDQEAGRDAERLGRVLAEIIDDARQTAGDDAARAIVADPTLHTERLDVQLHRLDAPGPGVSAAMLDAARRGTSVSERAKTPAGHRISTLIPLPAAAGSPPMGLMVTQIMSRQAAHARAIISAATIAGILLVLAVAAASSALGYWFIGRPVKALVQHARRVAAGDLGSRLQLAQRDEIGVLAAELDAMAERLQTSMDARIAALEQVRHADRLATVGQLASGIAHELGTPLNVVGGRAQMICEGDLTPEDVTESARIIHEQTRRMAQIIRQLLDFARTRSIEPSPVALRAVAERTVPLVRPLAHRAAVELEIAGDAIQAICDDGRIQQALLNLLVNAIQATPRGGHVTVAFDTIVRALPAGPEAGERRWARLRVIDDGAGMDAETLRHVFEPFFTTKPVGEGTGLGLSVTYGIVRDFGGWIDVNSAPGQGSTFAVYLPAA